jgi:hypothetical protein
MNEAQSPPPSSDITQEDWQRTAERVRAWIEGVWEEVQPLKATVEKLQDADNRNWQNSSQPPAQDRPEQKGAKGKAVPPRKRGGQRGHRGHHRVLVGQVDEVIVGKPVSCARCGAWLLGEDPNPYRHQVTELPIVKPQVIEHQAHRLECPWCGLVNRGELPPEVAASHFGLNVMSLIGLWMGRYWLSKRQASQFLWECFGIEMAASTVVNHQTTISQALAEPVAELQPDVQQQPARKLMRRAGGKPARVEGVGCGRS